MIDLHCHLDLYPEPRKVVAQCHEAGVYVLSVTTTPKAWRGTTALAKGCPRIRTALGLHPQLAHDRIAELPLFDALLPETKYVGEIGLDGSPELKAHAPAQLRVFEHVLRSASKGGGRIMSIHSRRATEEVLDVLVRFPDAGVPVLHWFSGSKRQLDRAIGMGCWFSVGPAMLRSKRGRCLVASMPRDRVLTETDGPFASAGNRPLTPLDASSAVRELGAIWGEPLGDTEARLRTSLKLLVSLGGHSTVFAPDVVREVGDKAR